jgi:hypothetical protein
MSREITISQQIAVSKAFVQLSKALSIRVDWTGTEYSAGTTNLTSIPSSVPVSATLVSYGWSFFRNLSATETIQVGVVEDPVYGSQFIPFIQLLPGEVTVVPLATLNSGAFWTLSAQSLGADAQLEFLVLER